MTCGGHLINSLCYVIGADGQLPSRESLSDSGVMTYESEADRESVSKTLAETLAVLGRKGETGGKSPSGIEGSQQLVATSPGLPALPNKMVVANRYVDFTELPPAKGKGRSVSQGMEGQVVVIQATDLMQSRRIIPDLATWSQCFALYVAIVAKHHPHRVQELMAYQSMIAKASLKYKWPAWVVYDQNFRAEVAGKADQSWAKVDPSIYAQCFTGQSISAENWCSRCQSLDHTALSCPYRPRKRPWSAVSGPPGQQNWSARSDQHQGGGRPDQLQACIKYNKFNGDCRFGKQCRFRHVCSSCGEPHPATKCKAGGGAFPPPSA